MQKYSQQLLKEKNQQKNESTNGRNAKKKKFIKRNAHKQS